MLAPFVARESVVNHGMPPRGRSRAGAWVRRLTPLAWLFVVLAGLDLVQRLLWLPVPPTLTTSLAGIARAVSPALVVVLPAAVLVGEPTAWRTSRLILVGALALVGAEFLGLAWRIYWASAVAPAVTATERAPTEPLSDLIQLVVALARLAGPILLGVGLSRLLRDRAAAPSERPTVGALVVIALGTAVAGNQLLAVLGEHGPLHRLEVVAGVFAALVAIAWACLAAVALPRASTDRPSRRGRIMLAIGALAFVATAALSIVNAAAIEGLVEVPSGFFVLSSVLSGVGAILLIAGFAAGVPSSDAADARAPGSDRALVESPGMS
jgi:hypothetical protein